MPNKEHFHHDSPLEEPAWKNPAPLAFPFSYGNIAGQWRGLGQPKALPLPLPTFSHLWTCLSWPQSPVRVREANASTLQRPCSLDNHPSPTQNKTQSRILRPGRPCPVPSSSFYSRPGPSPHEYGQDVVVDAVVVAVVFLEELSDRRLGTLFACNRSALLQLRHPRVARRLVLHSTALTSTRTHTSIHTTHREKMVRLLTVLALAGAACVTAFVPRLPSTGVQQQQGKCCGGDREEEEAVGRVRGIKWKGRERRAGGSGGGGCGGGAGVVRYVRRRKN